MHIMLCNSSGILNDITLLSCPVLISYDKFKHKTAQNLFYIVIMLSLFISMDL